ncbi:LysR family transcriptional regulator [Cognatishimia maritima]|uniref:DNA-binding transcriptional regulator, LysR family n=1 Tax=Cognatishimia maritima TaxID=870908 RepID=A0A1M5KDP9_9RHOB|nr:LysR family transcriptional regulator [Cognatishimia maritima]SHG50599.1 DNA-binding transcriptional regulator, LysR family [Cognatishimia maritima]
MQEFDWNDLRHLLAVHRTGSYSEAGRRLGVSETTVSRRIAAIEAALRVKLIQKRGSAGYEMTDIGHLVLEHAEAIEQQSGKILELSGGQAATVGTVRLSAVPLVINRILVPELHRLHRRHPELVLELIPDTRNIDLTKREADLAIRLARPQTGGLKTSARRIGQLQYAVFGRAGLESDKSNRSDWIIYDDSQASFPQAIWLNTALGLGKDAASPLRVGNAETAIEAIAAGVGKSILPRRVAAMDARLRELVRPTGTPPLPTRDVWLLSHSSQTGSVAVSAVKDWLDDIPWS